MKVSVVTTLYRSAPYLEEFRRRVVATVGAVTDDFEVVFVDDGSPDDSGRIVRGFLGGSAKTKLVSLSRNFGHFASIMVGLEHAQGDVVFLIDCDLEEEPELFAPFYRTMLDAPADDPIDVVYGVQARRRGRWTQRIAGAAFYRLFNLLSDVSVPHNAMIARLMSRRYVDALLRHRERELFLLGVMTLAGFRQVPFGATKSRKGTSSYTLRHKILLTVKSLAAYSDKPLTGLLVVGATISLVAMVAMSSLIISVIVFHRHYLTGWASLAVLISLFGGLIISALGIVGFYLGRVYVEVKGRPTITKQIDANFGLGVDEQPRA